MIIDQHPSPFFTKGRLLVFKPSFIVIHWIAGSLQAADSVFTNPKTTPQRSAHYAVGGADQNPHQYVDEKNTAWHAGNWLANLRSIGVELEGGPNPDVPVTDAVYEKASELIAEIWLRNKSIPIKRESLKPHREFKATMCPGNVNIDRLYQMAVVKYTAMTSAPTPPPAAPVEPFPGMTTQGFPKTVTAYAGARRRSETNTKAAILEQYKKDTPINVIGIVRGESVTMDNHTSNEWYNTGYGYVWTGATK